jgi:hypothetical protein
MREAGEVKATTARQPRPEGRQRPPDGLSAWARGVWVSLLEASDFDPHELISFARALTWWDLSDVLLTEAAALSGRDRLARLKSAGDAATTALRHWRGLRFTSPARPAPRLGRPSGPSWSAVSKAALEARAHDNA